MTQYRRPDNVEDVVRTLSDAEGNGRLLVGGTDLLVAVRRRPLDPLVLVDLKAVADLPPAIEVTEAAVRFGPTATMSDLAADSRLAAMFPALVAASRVVGSLAIRNRASLIGNICNASPAGDTAPALLIYGARVTIVGRAGERTIPLSQFFVGPGLTTCGPDEFVLRVDLPRPADGYRSAFERLTRRRGVDLATVSVAAGVSAEGSITLGLGAVGPTPLLTETAAAVDLEDVDAVEQAVKQLIGIATPISDLRSGREYRQAMIAVLARRAVSAAARSVGTKGPST